jgi:hypothetical protein
VRKNMCILIYILNIINISIIKKSTINHITKEHRGRRFKYATYSYVESESCTSFLYLTGTSVHIGLLGTYIESVAGNMVKWISVANVMNHYHSKRTQLSCDKININVRSKTNQTHKKIKPCDRISVKRRYGWSPSILIRYNTTQLLSRRWCVSSTVTSLNLHVVVF